MFADSVQAAFNFSGSVLTPFFLNLSGLVDRDAAALGGGAEETSPLRLSLFTIADRNGPANKLWRIESPRSVALNLVQNQARSMCSL
uniref:Uncharacterized protein n=1 Tax=Zea mays TaxID=4577 RepID=C4J806_MAIZE|nr:unknown [Zea mays]